MQTKTFDELLELNLNLVWFGRVAYYDLDNDRYVRVEVKSHDHGSTSSELVATVINRLTGPIETCRFHFETWLKDVARADKRSDWNGNFHLSLSKDHWGGEWYIAIPATTHELGHAIKRWIAMIR